MEKKVLDWSEKCKIPSRKWQTLETIDTTLRCIKVRLTPVSCKLKNLLQMAKSYHILHRAETQLLYDRGRSINSILEQLDTH